MVAVNSTQAMSLLLTVMAPSKSDSWHFSRIMASVTTDSLLSSSVFYIKTKLMGSKLLFIRIKSLHLSMDSKDSPSSDATTIKNAWAPVNFIFESPPSRLTS